MGFYFFPTILLKFLSLPTDKALEEELNLIAREYEINESHHLTYHVNLCLSF